jgi:hypothetical protein
MTVSSIKVKIVRKPTLKLKVLPRFPSSVTVASPILLDTTGGNYAFSLDLNTIEASILASVEAALAGLYQPIENVDQPITAGSTATVNNASFTVRVNKTVGGAITLTLPLASFKTVPVLIADWKGDAGTNNITINPSGSEKIQGRSSWVIAADNGSVFLRPIAGVGYAL